MRFSKQNNLIESVSALNGCRLPRTCVAQEVVDGWDGYVRWSWVANGLETRTAEEAVKFSSGCFLSRKRLAERSASHGRLHNCVHRREAFLPFKSQKKIFAYTPLPAKGVCASSTARNRARSPHGFVSHEANDQQGSASSGVDVGRRRRRMRNLQERVRRLLSGL